MAAPSTALSMGKFPATYSTVPHLFYQYGGACSYGYSAVTQSLCLPYLVGRGFVPPDDMVSAELMVIVVWLNLVILLF